MKSLDACKVGLNPPRLKTLAGKVGLNLFPQVASKSSGFLSSGCTGHGFQRPITAGLLFLILLLNPFPSSGLWFPIFSSSTRPPSSPQRSLPSPSMRADFSLNGYDDPDGAKLVAEARDRELSLSMCWRKALGDMFASCAEILADEERHMRLAWMLSDCFVADSGRPGLPECGGRHKMRECRKKLQGFEEHVYLKFFTETNRICHQQQADVFKRQTEGLINGLLDASHMAEEKLQGLEAMTEHLLHSTSSVQDTLSSVDKQTRELATRSGDVDARIQDVLRHSEDISERTKGIVASQVELQKGQARMRETIEVEVEILHRSYKDLGNEMEALRKEAVTIEKEIGQVGTEMTDKMSTLQSTAEGIGEAAIASLDKQKQLLSGQIKAIEGLDFLTKFQSQALEESRENLQRIAEFSHTQQKQLLRRQQEIQQAHDRLILNSQSILAAQEKFESKQTKIFAALEKLFMLYNTILMESRFMKSLFFYFSVIFLAYILTSAKETFSVRARLFLGICLTFILELLVNWLSEDNFALQQTWIKSKVYLVRSTFMLVALVQLLYSFFTFRDYEMLNHRMLQELKAKIDIMEQNTGKGDLLAYNVDVEPDLYDWIDEDFPEDVSVHEDPDYLLPEEVMTENSIACSVKKSYELRPRS